MYLSNLHTGATARIICIRSAEALTRKLLEMGIEEGSELRVMHEGPVGRDPMAISLNDRLIALRRSDASLIEVELL